MRRKWVDRLGRWLIPINLRRLLKAQGALDSILAFAFTVAFFSELARPGTFTSRDALQLMSHQELRRYLAFYLWYAFMYLAQLTVSLLLFLDVRNVKYDVDGRRRTIFMFLVFSPTLVVNLVLSAANVLYFPWAPLGLLYVLHILFVAPYWLYALRYYHWLGDGELVHFEAPLVVTGGAGAGAPCDRAAAAGTASTSLSLTPGPWPGSSSGGSESPRVSGSAAEHDGVECPPPASPPRPPRVRVLVGRLVSIDDE